MKDLFFKTIMLKGEAGGTIQKIEKTGSTLNVDTYTITFNDGETQTFEVTNGSSIAEIEKTDTSGLLDTYTVTLTDGSTTQFVVRNGEDGAGYEVPAGSVLYYDPDGDDSAPEGYEASTDPNGDAILTLQKAQDNNLLCGGNLGAYSTIPWGWIANRESGDFARWEPNRGFRVPTDSVAEIVSSRYAADRNVYGSLAGAAFSLSVFYSIGTIQYLAKQEGISWTEVPAEPVVDANGVRIEISQYYALDVKSLHLTVSNTTGNDVYILGVKLERGETATPFPQISRDIGTNLLVNSVVTRLDNSKGTIAANTDLNTIQTNGFYWLNSTYDHLPHTGAAAGILEVLVPVESLNDGVIIQRYTRFNAEYEVIHVFVRVRTRNEWHNWKTILTVS